MGTNKNAVALLAICQAMLLTSNIVMVGLNSVIGYSLLGDDKSLATLPVTAYILGTALMTVPASFWMKRVGRRAGFITGAILGLLGSLTGALALVESNFRLLCLGTLLIGGYNAFGQYYRFAAAESVGPESKSRAISLVLAAGIVGAIVGPESTRLTKNVLPMPFAGTYFFLAGATVLAVVVLLFLKLPPAPDQNSASKSRPLSTIVRQDRFVVAVMSGMFGYAIMNFLMTAAPIAMIAHHHAYSQATFVIEWHALAMFAPSFGTGLLIKHFGNITVLRVGAALSLGCIAITTLAGTSVSVFLIALILLGVGWNFLYVGGTTLLTETYHPSERAKVQATNDQLVFLATASSSVLSGWLFQHAGWPAMAIWSLPLPVAILIGTVWLARRSNAPGIHPTPEAG